MKVPVKLIRTDWPPNEGVMPGDKRFDAIYCSAKDVGILEPITLKLDWSVIDGNHRLSVAKHLGIECVNVRFWTGTEFVS